MPPKRKQPKRRKAIRPPKVTLQRKKKSAPKVWGQHVGGFADWIASGKWARVSSSNVKAIKYDKGSQNLYVTFLAKGNQSESIYVYYGIDQNTARKMYQAASMGKFVWWMRRNNIPYKKIQ